MSESDSTRRRFLKQTGLASSLVAAGTTIMPQLSAQTARATDNASCLDYRRSYICGTSDLNSVRFWIESRTTIVDLANQVSTVFYQCASCKSENTFGKQDLFLADNYDFLPIFGGGHWLIFRRHAGIVAGRYREVIPSPNAWGEPRILAHEASNVRTLESWESIRDATAEGVPLVAQTELVDRDTSRKAVVECPVKTMNISREKEMYQVDTGPVALPDLARQADPLIDCLRLAFVAFNRQDFADFVIEQPTAVVENGQERCRVHHYCDPISLPATNRVLTHD